MDVEREIIDIKRKLAQLLDGLNVAGDITAGGAVNASAFIGRKPILSYSGSYTAKQTASGAALVLASGTLTIPYTGYYQAYINAPIYTSSYTSNCGIYLNNSPVATAYTNAKSFSGTMTDDRLIQLTKGTYSYEVRLNPQNETTTATLESYQQVSYGIIPV